MTSSKSTSFAGHLSLMVYQTWSTTRRQWHSWLYLLTSSRTSSTCKRVGVV
ncbi:unnamed protein product [Durusdinium trenchii]|uniref:Uncharacterized protein n=1 Tax=Durusdinium trenchii TaxID=1381693 RepID=A0ABP0I410_9DINO